MQSTRKQKRRRLRWRRVITAGLLVILLTIGLIIFVDYQIKRHKEALKVAQVKAKKLAKAQKKAKEAEKRAIEQKKLPNPAWKQPIAARNDKAKNIELQLRQLDFQGTLFVIENGEMLLHQAYGKADNNNSNTVNSLYGIGSIQKGMTAYMIMLEVQKGRLKLTDTIDRFYPNLDHSGTVTIQQLLWMTSGYKLGNVPNDGNSEQSYIDKDIAQTSYSGVVNEENWEYQPINYEILSGILLKLEGKSYYNLFKELVSNKVNDSIFFYQDALLNPNRTHGFEQDAVGNWSMLPDTEQIKSAYAHEFGTGNVFMSAESLYNYYFQLLTGKLLDDKTLDDMLNINDFKNYTSGLYEEADFIWVHGLFAGFDTMGAISHDSHTAIIALSNHFSASKTKALQDKVKELFSTLDFSDKHF